nr:hypothetical protein [uncultured Actinoplanes sp.]
MLKGLRRGRMRLAEAEAVLGELESLIRRINRTNAATGAGDRTAHNHVRIRDGEGG